VVTLAPGVEGPIPAALPAGVDGGAATPATADAMAGPASSEPPKRRRPAKPRPQPEQPPSDFEP